MLFHSKVCMRLLVYDNEFRIRSKKIGNNALCEYFLCIFTSQFHQHLINCDNLYTSSACNFGEHKSQNIYKDMFL